MPVQAESAAAQTAKAPTAPDDVAIAARWLDALRDANPSELEASSRYPFEVHDEGGYCKDQTASSPEQLASVLQCLLTNTLLLDLLRRHNSGAIESLADVHLSAWAKKWHIAPTPKRHIVTGFFTRDDARAHFDLWVADGGIRGVWKTGVEGSTEIAVATEWLEALRTRDIERLARVTIYPFEVRDTRRDAKCGKRTAEGRSTLSGAVDCLFRSELLHRALLDTPSPRIVAFESTDSLPDWVQPWWRENEHRGLRRLFTILATVDGYEFDFQLLVEREGVRVVWKLGSLESRN